MKCIHILYFYINNVLKHAHFYKFGLNLMIFVYIIYVGIPYNIMCIKFYYEFNIIISISFI